MNLLCILSSVSYFEKTQKEIGTWLEELYIPYYELKNQGVKIRFASPLGGKAPVDPLSIEYFKTHKLYEHYLADNDFSEEINNTLKLSSINSNDYTGLFLPGGYSPLFDLFDDKDVNSLILEFNASNKLVSSICHAGGVLANIKNEDGSFFIKDKKVTSFSNEEEDFVGMTEFVPFLPETELIKSGAIYHSGAINTCFVICDKNLITGQNPASAHELANKILSKLQVSI